MSSKLHTSDNGGYILPMILTISIATIIILTILVSRFVISTDISHNSYYTRIAKEAARAGIVYANACYSKSEFTQTWGAAAGRPNLTPNTDCTGAPVTGKSKYLIDSDVIKTTFEVGDIDNIDSSGLQLAAEGHVEYIDNLGNTIHVSSAVVKQVSWTGGNTAFEAVPYSIAIGQTTCATVTGSVYCWGSNFTQPTTPTTPPEMGGGLGNGGTPYSTEVPVKVTGLDGEYITRVYAGTTYMCAISYDGKLFCWGQMGWNGPTMYSYLTSSIPKQIKGPLEGLNVTDFLGLQTQSCAIASGKIYCWSNVSSSLPVTSQPELVSDTYLGSGYNAVKLSQSNRSYEKCAIMSSGQLYCWGPNGSGILGVGDTTQHLAPYPTYQNGYIDGHAVDYISTTPPAPSWHYAVGCATSNGKPYCVNPDGLTNYKYAEVSGSYTPPMKDVQVGQVSGSVYACGLAKDGMYCWNALVWPTAMVKIPSVKGLPTTGIGSLYVSGGSGRTCGLWTGGRVICWRYPNLSGGIVVDPREIGQVYKLVHGVYF